MTKKQLLLVDLRLARAGWAETVERIFRLQDMQDELIDRVWALLSPSEQRKLVRHLNGVWRKNENHNFGYANAFFNKSIEILEARR